MVGLGDLAGGEFLSVANDTSEDGSIVVGHSISANGIEPFRWTSAGGMVGLGHLGEQALDSRALGVSDDGSTVVGSSIVNSAYQAFRWTTDEGMVSLGGFARVAWAVSADGSVIVGAGDNFDKTFIWDATNGSRDLKDVLTSMGVGSQVQVWTLSRALAVSADGMVIVGYGLNAGQVRGWMASLYPACDDGLDNDGDGLADFPNDPGCRTSTSSNEAPRCDDDLDNDGDGMTDWDGGPLEGPPDPDCTATPWKNTESGSACGLGAEIALVFALLSRSGRRRMAAVFS
jgi:uncharacterized membrane protein